MSLCAEPMIELSNPGASGSIFYVTQGMKRLILVDFILTLCLQMMKSFARLSHTRNQNFYKKFYLPTILIYTRTSELCFLNFLAFFVTPVIPRMYE